MAFGAILAGVRKRDATCAGAHIDLLLVEAMLSMPVYEMRAELAGLREMRPSHRPVPTADGFIILTIVSDLNWRAVARALGQPELGTEPRLTDVKARTLHWNELHQLVCDRAPAARSSRPRPRCSPPVSPPRGTRHGLDPRGRAPAHPGVFRTVADAAGEFIVTATPFRFDDVITPPDGSAVPPLGADTDVVLKEVVQPAAADPPGGAA